MFIKPTANAKSLWDIDEDLATDAVLYPKNDAACPWDADIEVQGEKVILTGNLQAGGIGAGEGECVCTVSVSSFSKFYEVSIPNDTPEEKLKALAAGGWINA